MEKDSFLLRMKNAFGFFDLFFSFFISFLSSFLHFFFISFLSSFLHFFFPFTFSFFTSNRPRRVSAQPLICRTSAAQLPNHCITTQLFPLWVMQDQIFPVSCQNLTFFRNNLNSSTSSETEFFPKTLRPISPTIKRALQ